MDKFTYTIQDPLGIHARPASLLVKEAKRFSSKIMVHCGGGSADATRVIALMTLGIHQGQTVEVTAEGADEQQALVCMKEFFDTNL